MGRSTVIMAKKSDSGVVSSWWASDSRYVFTSSRRCTVDGVRVYAEIKLVGGMWMEKYTVFQAGMVSVLEISHSTFLHNTVK